MGEFQTNRLRDADERASISQEIIVVDGLQKIYEGNNGTTTAIDSISFSIERGEVVGLLGPNGAGKTTTIKLILGLIEPTDGSIRVNGVDPQVDTKETYRQVSAVLEGARNVYWRLTVRENLRYFSGIQGIHPGEAREEHDRLLSLVDLEHKADEQLRNLSQGMQQKACLACALARETPIVFLDEPTLGLDVEAARDLQNEIQRLAEQEGRTIVLSSHDMDVIQTICDRVIIINNGEIIAEDSVEELLELFSSQTYRVHLEEPLPDDARLVGYDPRWESDRTSFEITLQSSDDFYRFTDAMEEANAKLDSIDSVKPDLEEIFLSIVDNESITASLDRSDRSTDRGDVDNSVNTSPVSEGDE
ncbi:ABC transporter ATP-binding protein [Natrinema salsiterrestre]|uniref:ABC transporter ATP-binding protein n=1 Tax=Natrinema salsiterrestre TaxID=2950540 RepID=A0A9Q4Q4J4_9EURY|nr:ABC transporter ATP-binding protein [Natrinema salsiterrestre]MDF9747482.1 ABC transporter ATP-binding protein [Natrinema salsiterrestre]